MKTVLRSAKWWFPWVAAVLSVVGFNAAAVHVPANSALSSDPRNETVQWAVYHRWGISPATIVLDVRSLDFDAAMADVDRGLFQIAERFSERRYDKVLLAYQGEAKFYLDGAYFQQLGSEYAWQNPIALVRELPQNVRELDGAPAFETWTGGWLGVASAQMRDHEELHYRWYLEQERRRLLNGE
jgi:hypothetical protein